MEQVLSIIRWSEPNRAEEASLLRDGWRQEAISLDGAQGSLYSRPGLQAGGGLWKRAYVQRGGDWFEVSLALTGGAQALAGEKAFAALLDSWRWEAP